jgi:hypothetical protein
VVIPVPAGVVAGDVLLAQVTYNTSGAITAPAGWSLVRSDVNTTAVRQSVFVHVAGSSEPPSYTFTLAAAHGAVGTILAYTGVDTSNPIDASSGRANASSTSFTAQSLTASGPNEMLVGLFGAKGPVTITQPAGMTERGELTFNTSGEKVTNEAADVLLSAAGPTGNRVATASPAAYNIGQLVALRPAP